MSAITQRYVFSGSGEDFGPRKGRLFVALHTFENSDPTKNTMRDALAGARWQDADNVIGSYNRLIPVDGVLGCVPDERSSGGINPGSAAWNPDPWLYQYLPAYAVNDPNAYCLQLCAMGQRLYYDTNGWPPGIIDGFARSIIDEEDATGREMLVVNHFNFQDNRSDAGKAIDLVLARIKVLRAAPRPEDLLMITNYTDDTVLLDVNARVRSAPTGGTVSRSFLVPATGNRWVNRIGTLTNAEGEWSVYWVNSWNALGYTLKQNIVETKPRVTTVESGITQAQLEKAKSDARAEGRREGIQAARDDLADLT